VRKYDLLDMYLLLNNNGFNEELIKLRKDSDKELIEYYRSRFKINQATGMLDRNAMSRVDEQTLGVYHRKIMHLLRKVLDINHIDTIIDRYDVYQEFVEKAKADDLSHLRFADNHKPKGDTRTLSFFD